MQLIATKQTAGNKWQLFDDQGRAFIQRTRLGKEWGHAPAAWHSPDRTAEEWLALQRRPQDWTRA